MPYTTRVHFRGLCGLVPGDDLSNPDLPWVGVFLPKADAHNQKNFSAESLPVHLPFLRYRLSDQQGSEAPDGFGFASVLNQDIVLVPPDGSPAQPIHADFDPNPGSQPATEADRTLLNWVVDVSAIAPAGMEVVDSDCFADKPRENRVAARIHLLQGHLQTDPDRLSRNNGQLLEARLGNSKNRQVIAGSFFVDLECADGSFKIRMNRFGDPLENCGELTFLPPEEEGAKLEISVINLCPDEIFLERGSLLVAPGPDDDFRWNYLLSNENFNVSNFDVPVAELPLQADDEKGSGGLDAVRCSPPRFAAAAGSDVTSMVSLGQTLSK